MGFKFHFLFCLPQNIFFTLVLKYPHENHMKKAMFLNFLYWQTRSFLLDKLHYTFFFLFLSFFYCKISAQLLFSHQFIDAHIDAHMRILLTDNANVLVSCQHSASSS